MKLYYRKIIVKNQHILNEKGPKIILANHPNTLIDAWMVGYISKEPIYYMAKGTFFNTRWKKKLLMSLGMIPINRSQDQSSKVVSNTDSFEKCYQILEQGKSLLIFPEGNSFSERLLRKLKSGSARIALQTELRNDGQLGLKIIPVGLVYVQPEKFRSAVYATVGEPISPLAHLDLFKTDSLKAARLLTEEFREGLSKLLVGSESKEHETLSEQIIQILTSNYSDRVSKGVEADVNMIRKINNKVISISKTNVDQLDELKRLVYQINWQTEKLNVRAEFLDRNFRSNMFIRQIIQSIFGLVLGLPLFLWGMIHNAIPYYFTDWIIPKIVKDIEYYAPIAILLGLVIYPLNYLGFVYLGEILFDIRGWYKVIYFTTMPVTGMFAYYFYHYYKHISFKLSFTMQMNTEGDAIAQLKSDREKLKEIVL